jgi:hypothetical protein
VRADVDGQPLRIDPVDRSRRRREGPCRGGLLEHERVVEVEEQRAVHACAQ